MFDGITVSVPREDNLLIADAEKGWYLSVLFQDQSAAENGRILEHIGVFRDAGMYYVEADLACAAVGLRADYFTGENGKTVLRVSDENRLLTTEELRKSYLPGEEEAEEAGEAEEPEEETAVRHIYVLCTTPEHPEETDYGFTAKEVMDDAGLGYTRFLGEDASDESILQAAASGAVGLIPRLKADGTPDLGALTRMNDRLAALVRRRTHLAYTTGDEDADRLLLRSGYRVIKPDFILESGAEAELLFSEIRAYLDTGRSSCTVLVGDGWNCSDMTELLSNMNPDWYAVSGLGR